MATFDDKSIFGKREEPSKKTEEIEKDDAVSEELSEEPMEEIEELAVEDVEALDEDESARVIGEEFVESEKAQKIREKKELKEKKLQEKAYNRMVKNHRKAMRLNPENIKRYDTDPEKGLPDEVVEKRILDDVVNATKKGSTKSRTKIVISNIFTFFNLLTLSIAIWLMTIQAWTDLVFLLIVLANTGIGIYQEIKAKNKIDKLALLSVPTAVVIRGGVKQEIGVGEVVLDDLLVLSAGNQICADSIVTTGSIEVNESLLTGESDSIIKKAGDLLFSGSFVVSGNCRARVDKVGKDNYIEKLSNQAKRYQKPNSELLKSLKSIIVGMSFLIVPIGITLFCLQLFISGVPYVTAVRKTAGAMIGMIPSGLWLLTSVALFAGVIKLSQRNVLVQELYCIEMLARINVLCLDKTGTITDGRMSVKNVIDFNSVNGMTTENVISAMLNALNEENITALALKEKFGLNKRMKAIGIIPFSSQRKFNAVTFDKIGTFALGAPEFVLKADFIKIKKEVEKYAAQGYRVLCLAHFNGNINNNELPVSTPEIISLILIEDNIRPDAINTINYFKESGVAVKVISGDDPITVSKISERAGIENADQYISLEGLSDADVERAALKYTVFGRVSPSQKKLLVMALKSAGKKVAMTGDGVNDILALREADCSIAIASGSDAARNVSHLVLLDSNFDSMPKVVAEGRRVINNVTSVASLFLTKTIFSLLLAIQALLSKGTYPISTNQLIIIDIFAIGIPSFILALEPNNKEVDGNFLGNILKGALPGALTILVISVLIFGLSDSLSLDDISVQTIIGIAATHTCLMVLFKACKPLNTLRKALCIGCYTAFMIIIFLLPQFLEFRPLVNFSQYYSPNLKREVMTYVPEIRVSDDYYYVFNGKYINYQTVSSEKNISISSIAKDGKYYYVFNGTNIEEEIVIPQISFLPTGEVVLGGYEIFYKNSNGERIYLTYTDNYADNFKLDKDGYLLYKNNPSAGKEEDQYTRVMRTLTETSEYYHFYNKYGGTKTADVEICVMPTVEIRNDQLLITSVVSSVTESSSSSNLTYKTELNSRDNMELSINPKTMELLINGNTVSPTLADGTTSSETYKINMPVISCNSDKSILFNGLVSAVSVSHLGLEIKNGLVSGKDSSLIQVIPVDASYYLTITNPSVDNYNTGVRLSNPLICPEVAIAENNHYIINGYYTEYVVSATTPNPRIDSEYNLILGGITTDYKIPATNVQTTTGGIVNELSTPAKIFLLMLCLLSTPLMRLLQAIVPYIKRQVELVQRILSKM